MRTLEYTITAGEEGRTVEQFLRRSNGFSARLVVKLKHHPQGILKNGEHARTVDLLRQGDILTINIHDPDSPTTISDLKVPVLYEDEDVIVYDKPFNMPCHTAKNHMQDTLANVYAAQCAKERKNGLFRVINRLDKDTTGAVLVCKNRLAASKLAGQTQKSYAAIVCGQVLEDSGVIEQPIARLNEHTTIRIVSPDGQYAKTQYQVRKRGENYTYLGFVLSTGRTHQIRVHMAHLGHPLAGDDMYGGDVRLLTRQALHCETLTFESPVTGEMVTVHAPLHEDMQKALETL